MRRKVYGSYQENKCPFCSSTATVRNSQGVPVCQRHKNENLEGMKCVCGMPLDIREGKYGVFFTCISCGPINMKKGLEINGYPLISINDL